MITQLFSKFQNKLLVLLFLSTLIPVAIVGGYSTLSYRKVLTELLYNQMVRQGTDSESKISSFLKNVKADILYLSQTPPVQGIVRSRANKGIDPQDKSSYQDWKSRLEIIFNSFLDSKPYYYQLRYLDENGNELVRMNSKNGTIQTVPDSQLQNKATDDYFIETMKLSSGEIFVSQVNLNRENGEIEVPHIPVIRYSTPIYSASGEKKGIVIANVFADSFLEMVDVKTGEQSNEAFIINPEGYYIYHRNESKEWGFDLNKQETVVQDYPEEISQKLLSFQTGFISEGIDWVISYNPIFPNTQNQKHGFVLVYAAPKDVVFAPINNLSTVAILITGFALVVVLQIGSMILKNLLGSIRDITGVVSSFSIELLATIEQQERMTVQQSASVQETTVAIDRINAASADSARQAQNAAIGGKHALVRVAEGSKAVSQTFEEMETLKEKVEAIASRSFSLNEQTNKISTISNLVSNLATETNLLALNAAVEAVRAGDQGKGFGVVASEIRKLADRSKQSTQNISTLVQDIERAVNSMALAAHEGQTNVETGVKIAQNTAEVFTDIASGMEQIVEHTQQIALTAQQQSLAIEQVMTAMNDLTHEAAETATSMTHVKTGIQKLNETALNLKSMI
ncbi:methyl-accepting chemotaxis protein [Laspinema palackyanum]|uniref:methyl-accepting chemotaxis protein n=1 Tax=Laspinema palackyanum TaxID=3231601 RepID=UPI00345D7597|nr:methyl-accepting chemotaxis protein [Laspinema sp. D2c]